MEIYAHHMFILYLLIAANFMAPLVGCKMQRILQDSMLLKHIIGFMTLYFFVVLTSQPDVHPTRSALQAVAIYVWFIMTTRTTTRIMAAIFVLLFALTILNSWKNYLATHPGEHNDEDLKRTIARISLAQQLVQYTIVGLTVVGFLYYLYLKEREYGNTYFDWTDFVVGRPNCKFDPTN
jgi:hypothetical protein